MSNLIFDLQNDIITYTTEEIEKAVGYEFRAIKLSEKESKGLNISKDLTEEEFLNLFEVDYFRDFFDEYIGQKLESSYYDNQDYTLISDIENFFEDAFLVVWKDEGGFYIDTPENSLSLIYGENSIRYWDGHNYKVKWVESFSEIIEEEKIHTFYDTRDNYDGHVLKIKDSDNMDYLAFVNDQYYGLDTAISLIGVSEEDLQDEEELLYLREKSCQ